MSAVASKTSYPDYQLAIFPPFNLAEKKQDRTNHGDRNHTIHYERFIKQIQSGKYSIVSLRGPHNKKDQTSLVETALKCKYVQTIDYSARRPDPKAEPSIKVAETAMNLLCASLRHPECHLTRLTLSGVGIQETDALSLVSTLFRNRSITHLDVSNCDFPGRSLQSLFTALEMNEESNLTYLNISKNGLQSVQGSNITRCLISQPMPKLRCLNLSECALYPAHMEYLMPGIRDGNLTIIYLDGNIDIGSGLHSIGEAIATNQHLKKISLKDCHFSTDDFFLFEQGFISREEGRRSDYSKLPELSINFDRNSLDSLAFSHISNLLYRTGRKIHLSLKSCEIGFEAVKYLSKPIAKKASLVTLDISNNPITEKEAGILYAALKANRSLREVLFRGCGLKNGRTFEVLMIEGHPTLNRLAW